MPELFLTRELKVKAGDGTVSFCTGKGASERDVFLMSPEAAIQLCWDILAVTGQAKNARRITTELLRRQRDADREAEKRGGRQSASQPVSLRRSKGKQP